MSSRFLFKQLCEELSADSCPAELNLMFLKPILFAGRRETSRVNMLVLRTSIFQGATIRPIIPRHRRHCLYCSRLNLLPRLLKNEWTYFQHFEEKVVKAKCKIWKRKQTKHLDTISFFFLFPTNPPVCRKIFTDEYYPSEYFPQTGIMGW